MCFDLGKITVPNDNQPIGTLHILIVTNLIFSLFANSVQTTGLIGMGEVLIDVFRPRGDNGDRLLIIDR